VRDQEKEIVRKRIAEAKAYIKEVQKNCPHRLGCLGPLSGWTTSIVQHYFDDGVLRGICTACLKIFEPGDPEYRYMAQHTSNKPSACASGSEIITLTPEVQKEIDSQFCVLDRDTVGMPDHEKSLKQFIMDTLFEEFKEKLYQDFIKSKSSRP
jgi:hypothetical protein